MEGNGGRDETGERPIFLTTVRQVNSRPLTKASSTARAIFPARYESIVFQQRPPERRPHGSPGKREPARSRRDERAGKWERRAKNTFIFLMPGEFQKCRSPARALEGRGGGCKGTAVERSGSRVFGGVQNIYDGHSGGGWSSLIPHGLAFCSPRQWRSSERSAGAHDAPECVLKPSNSAAFGSLEVADRREGG